MPDGKASSLLIEAVSQCVCYIQENCTPRAYTIKIFTADIESIMWPLIACLFQPRLLPVGRASSLIHETVGQCVCYCQENCTPRAYTIKIFTTDIETIMWPLIACLFQPRLLPVGRASSLILEAVSQCVCYCQENCTMRAYTIKILTAEIETIMWPLIVSLFQPRLMPDSKASSLILEAVGQCVSY